MSSDVGSLDGFEHGEASRIVRLLQGLDVLAGRCGECLAGLGGAEEFVAVLAACEGLSFVGLEGHL